MRIPSEKITYARESFDRYADVIWGTHVGVAADHPSKDPDEILERILCEFALISKTPIDEIKKRAKKRVMEKYATQG